MPGEGLGLPRSSATGNRQGHGCPWASTPQAAVLGFGTRTVGSAGACSVQWPVFAWWGGAVPACTFPRSGGSSGVFARDEYSSVSGWL